MKKKVLNYEKKCNLPQLQKLELVTKHQKNPPLIILLPSIFHKSSTSLIGRV